MASQQNKKICAEEFELIILLTEEMDELSKHGEWDKITEKQEVRQSLLNAYFQNPVDINDAAYIEQGIQRLLEMDKKILERGRRDLKSMSENLSELNQRKTAVNAYLSNE